MPDRAGPPLIVVGVDGSPTSVQALRWAAHYAELTAGELHAVTAWRMPTTYGWIPAVSDFDWAGHARSTLARALEQALDESQMQQIWRHVVEGHPATALLHHAGHADLVVLGSRGHGEYAGMLMGSVAQHVATQAACPVLIVRPTTTVADAPVSSALRRRLPRSPGEWIQAPTGTVHRTTVPDRVPGAT